MFITRMQAEAKQGVDWIEWRHLTPGSLFAWLDSITDKPSERYLVWLCLWNMPGRFDWQRRIGSILVGGRRITEFVMDREAVAYRLHDDPR